MLETIAFTSARKKMSVIVRDDRTGATTLYCKGADSAVLPLLRPGQDDCVRRTVDDMERFAAEGLRTLLVTSADLPNDKFDR
jgi:magnesium-transporting ATPase (P-type)